MEYLKEKKKSNTFNYFIFITVVPIAAVIAMFSYAFIHVKKDVDFISHELQGLHVIKQIQKTIFNIQRIRGLSCIEYPNERSIQEIESAKEGISSSLKMLKQNLLLIEDTTSLKDELLKFITSIENSSLENTSFENLSKVIHDFMVFSNRISFHCKLILDPDLDSYILINNVIYLLPELIEYNGQMRAVATSIKDNFLTPMQKQHVKTQLDKIEERLYKLNYNLFLFYESSNNNIGIKDIHNKMLEAQNAIVNFVNNKLLYTQKVALEPNGIFNLTTQNINLIIGLYNTNLKLLNNNLLKRLSVSNQLSIYIILAGITSILFIITINRIFYYKNREFISKIEELTITDAMTSLYNRRYFDEVFENYLKVQQRVNLIPIFIILDIDFFKQYNDTYGHQAGDLALIAVAKKLKNSLKRANDMVFRLGGEEFGILCTVSDNAKALAFADNIRKSIEDEKIEHKKNGVSPYLTISMGLIIIEPKSIKGIGDIYKCADIALYKAKENGRNQVVLYDTKNCLQDNM